MLTFPVRVLESAATRASQLAGLVFRGSVRLAESAGSLTDTATRNAAEAATQVSDAGRHRDRAYREAEALNSRRS